MGSWPENVGILAIECVFPSLYVDQVELEEFNGAKKGRCVSGSGQLQLGFCTDREDIHSICLTVVQRLLERYKIEPTAIGRLEVGSASFVDKSKSIKSVLMQLFEPYGVTDLEGLDANGCYGGTAALFNSIAWIESSSWNGRYAIVVAADVGVYADVTNIAAGAVAMLVGPNAPLVIDRGLRGTFMKYSLECSKTDVRLEHSPTVNNLNASEWYMETLQRTYQSYREKAQKQCDKIVTMDDFDYLLFHVPRCSVAKKAVDRLTVIDFINCISKANCESFKNGESHEIENAEKAILDFSKETYEQKTLPSLLLTSRIGNMNTASLYGSLVSLLISHSIEKLAGKKVGLFSYGSGLTGTMFSITIAKDCNNNSKLSTMLSKLADVKERLEKRKKVPPKDFTAIMGLREKALNDKVPIFDIDHLFSGSYYLAKIDELHRREYKRKTY
ncbi:hypothetical protein PPYR_00523 [Photinus pyralis]|uniref:Hydroxymethylglutaryl-CoA synthase n=1 Tax=Photinus pyralis TaxID=7054 RepID=A0A5N4B1W8_PHOPY|nr:hypothetical protein PPYR_00523 [Photinus pyralis]